MDVGTVYHGLTLLYFCGSGAFGEVYQCRDLSGKILAVKIISKHKLGDAWKRELRGVTHYRTITETSATLLQIYHVGEDEESFFYTMEAADSRNEQKYIPDTLAARLQNGAISPDELFPILKGIFLGIKTIHDGGFTHRDIKPDNILFVNGQPKLGDIGLVSSLSATLTQMAGTLEFLPPELRTGEDTAGTDRDARQMSDLYAFGKIIYCAATGLEATQFPTVPESLKLSQPVKYLLRFAFRLCEREPLKRLADIDKAERHLTDIERKLQHGETFFAHLHYTMGTGGRSAIYGFQLCRQWCLQHWLLTGLLLFVLLVAGYAAINFFLLRLDSETRKLAVMIREQKEREASKPQEFRLYQFCNNRYSLSFPASWKVIEKAEFLANFLKTMEGKTPPISESQIGALYKQKRHLQAIILPREPAVGKPYTIIEIHSFPRTGAQLRSVDDQALAEYLKPWLRQDIYGLTARKQTNLPQGFKSIIVFGQLPSSDSYTAMIFPQKNYSLMITMTSPRQYSEDDRLAYITMIGSLKKYETAPPLSIAKRDK